MAELVKDQSPVLSNVGELRVLVVAADPLARAGLATLLADQPGCRVVGQLAATARRRAEDADLAAEVGIYQPDVVVWDLGWDPAPDLDASLERLSELGDGGVPTLVLLPDEAHAADVWIAGVRGLLLRDAGADALVAALQVIAHGLVVLDPELAAGILSIRDHAPEPLIEELTPREMEVLQLLAEGLTNRAIAQRLDISEHTVKFHVNAILGKLGAQSRTEAVVRATRLGLILL